MRKNEKGKQIRMLDVIMSLSNDEIWHYELVLAMVTACQFRYFHTLDRVPIPKAHHLTFGPFKMNLNINCF